MVHLAHAVKGLEKWDGAQSRQMGLKPALAAILLLGFGLVVVEPSQ
jgi:hypothetical protein